MRGPIDTRRPIDTRQSPFQGLVGLWHPTPSSAGGSSIRDLLRANHGTLNGFASPSTISSGWNTSSYGHCLTYDGTNDYVSLPSLASQFSTEATFAAWLRLSSHSPGTEQGSWNLGSQDNSSHYVWSDGNIYDGTFRTTRVTVGAGVLSDRSRWHLVAVTCKPGTGNWVFYQNATVAATSTGGASITFPSAPRVGLGATWFNNYYFLGSIQWFGLWNRALTSDQLKQLYILSQQSRILNRVSILDYANAAASSGFQSAWARGSNVVLQPGITA